MSDKFYALKQDALECLRDSNITKSLELWNFDYKKRFETDPGQFAETRFSKASLPKIVFDRTKSQPENDKLHAQLFYGAMKDLTPVEAVDERIWVSLTLSEYQEYFKARWPVKNDKDVQLIDKQLDNHLFASTARKRFRDQAIARLWWAGRFVDRNLTTVSSKAFDVLYDIDSDILSQFNTRPALVSVRNVAQAIIEVTHNEFLGKMPAREWDRGKYRGFLKEIDLESGRQLLPHMKYEQVEEIVKKAFSRQFS